MTEIHAIAKNFLLSQTFFYWFVFCGIIMGGYLLSAFSVYHLLNLAIGKELKKSPLSLGEKNNITIKADIRLSILSGFFFSLGAACFMVCYQQGYTQAYIRWNVQDLGYCALSYILVLLLQDTYFYFLHRLSHRPFFFRWLHQGHHHSRPPTPWTCFAFEPSEAIFQTIFLLAVTFLIPLNIGVLISILLTMMIWAVGNHLGVKIVPSSSLSRKLGEWFIGSAHHLVHHQKYVMHYGLYFTFWDKLLGTQDQAYEYKRLSGSL